jgi:hypothetical protein
LVSARGRAGASGLIQAGLPDQQSPVHSAGRRFLDPVDRENGMTDRARAIMAVILSVAALLIAACHDHPESAGSNDHRGAYGGVEGGGF